MPIIEKKLKEWFERKIITQETYKAILDYEKNQKSKFLKNIFSYGLGIIASFSIGLGIISLIAANWYVIPSFLKFSFLFVIHFSLIPLILKKQSYIKESLIFIFIFLFLAEIALTSQVFQIDKDLKYLFFFWAILSVFPMLYSSNGWIPFFVFLISHIPLTFIIIEKLNLKEELFTAIFLSYLCISFCFFILSELKKTKNLIDGINYYTIIFFFFWLIVLHLNWYNPIREKNFFLYLNLFLIFVIFIEIYFINHDFFSKENPFLFILFAILFGFNYYLPAILKQELISKILGAFFFIVLNLFSAYYFFKLKIRWLFHFSIVFIIFRLLWIVFIEIFKDLTFTGIGLIVFGIMIFFALSLYKVIYKKFLFDKLSKSL